MTERFNVSGALLVKLFGRLGDEERVVRRQGRPGARHRRHAGDVRPGVLHRAHPGRRRWPPRWSTASAACWPSTATLTLGTLVALAALLDPAVRAADRAVQRAGRRDDRAGQLRAGLRGARPGADDRREAGRRGRCRAAPPPSSSHDVSFRYPSADEVSLASLESVAVLDQAPSQQVLHDVVVHRAEPGKMIALVGPSGAGKTTITSLVARLYDVSERRGAGRRPRRPRRDAGVAARRDRRRHPGRAHVPRHDPRQPALRPAGRHRRRAGRARCAPPRSGDLVASLPDGLDTVVGDRGYRLSGGEKQRLAIARLLLKAPDVVVLDEATAHLDSESEVAVQRALDDRARRAAPRWSSRTGCRPSATPTRSWSSTTAGSSSAAGTTSCSPPAACTPSCTAPSSPRRRSRRVRRSRWPATPTAPSASGRFARRGPWRRPASASARSAG